jgi:hypothetical protein
VSSATQDRTSSCPMSARAAEPKAGRMWPRRSHSSLTRVVGARSVVVAHHSSTQSARRRRPSVGLAHWPRSPSVVATATARSASALVSKLPRDSSMFVRGSRIRACHRPEGRRRTLPAVRRRRVGMMGPPCVSGPVRSQLTPQGSAGRVGPLYGQGATGDLGRAGPSGRVRVSLRAGPVRVAVQAGRRRLASSHSAISSGSKRSRCPHLT